MKLIELVHEYENQYGRIDEGGWPDEAVSEVQRLASQLSDVDEADDGQKQVVKLYHSGLSPYQIGWKMGKGIRWVKLRLKRAGIE